MSHRKKSIDAVQLDTNMNIRPSGDQDVMWYSPLEAPFHIAGFGWLQEEGRYRRLPAHPSHHIPDAVDQLANCTSGGQIRFTADATSLLVKVKLTGPANMYHMTATGQCGFDCYLGVPGEQVYYGTTTYDHRLMAYESSLFTNKVRENRLFTLNFPLYQGVEEIWIGLDREARISPPPSYDSNQKIVVYGTSITQGGCASRPGMSYTNILSRRMNLEFLNLGFSGNGKGEPELAHILADIPNPACLILDYEANCVSTELLAKTLLEFIAIYREKHPLTPILVISRITHAKEQFHADMAQERSDRKQIQQRVVEQRREMQDDNIYFCDGSTLLGADAHECTVDGSHPTDLGFLRMADGLTPILQQIVGG
ncbi:hypothetical protein BC351_03820 [Paenibacillus ferrarius]|uniref:SGNH hydrolase-type esterase domain-containing protein n=1 Tax=Paenibacillus ferrarius TaxID=1469647 RepID=A0A1V4HLT5_9BACL|nr:SGNH/GDSL hydrolase family protein [Paenibacillus ferrarius]OPH57654.1 hypothetical protein BC351_03820 [Paenibacillus ferrarius]